MPVKLNMNKKNKKEDLVYSLHLLSCFDRKEVAKLSEYFIL